MQGKRRNSPWLLGLQPLEFIVLCTTIGLCICASLGSGSGPHRGESYLLFPAVFAPVLLSSARMRRYGRKMWNSGKWHVKVSLVLWGTVSLAYVGSLAWWGLGIGN